MADPDEEIEEENDDISNILLTTIVCLNEQTAYVNSLDRRNLHPLGISSCPGRNDRPFRIGVLEGLPARTRGVVNPDMWFPQGCT